MPSSLTSNYLHTSILNYVLTGVSFTAPTTLWYALFTTMPQLNGTGGTEVSISGTGYGRKSISCAPSEWNGPSGANLEFSNAKELPIGIAPTADWGIIVGGGLYDSDIGGSNNLMFLFNLTVPRSISSGDGQPKVLVGNLRISRATC